MLHIHSGDWSARAASALFGGPHLAWTDNLFEGPLPPTDWNDPAWYAARGEALAACLGGRERAAGLLRKRHDIVRNALGQADEVTLWFDSCLYDMMLLCQFLAFTGEELRKKRVHLICEERRSDGSRFAGYAELDEGEFKNMFGRRRLLTEPMLHDGRESWRGFTSSTPEAWRGLARQDHPLTVFLAPAAQRLLEELPGENGLNRLEREIITALAAGCTRLTPLFKAVSAAEERPFFGDTAVWQALNRLATDPVPSVALHGPAALIPVNVYPPSGAPEFRAGAWRVELMPEARRAHASGAPFPGARARERWVANVHLFPGSPLLQERSHS